VKRSLLDVADMDAVMAAMETEPMRDARRRRDPYPVVPKSRSREAGPGAGEYPSPWGQLRKPDAAHVPPSTWMVPPVTKRDRSEARKRMASARCSGMGGSPIGMYTAMAWGC
jgi:hypothetical protein